MVMIDTTTILPFFLVLALVYGSLEISRVFSNKGVKGIISIVIAFFAITSPELVAFLGFVMPYAAVFFIVFFLLGFLISFFKEKDHEVNYIMIVVILALVLMFLSNYENFSLFNLQNENFLGMIVLLVIAVIFYAAFKIKEQ